MHAFSCHVLHPVAGDSSSYFNFSSNRMCNDSYALCSSHLPLNGCTVQYTTDPSWRNLSPPVWGQMNTPFELPAPTVDTGTYFYQATVNIDESFLVVLQRVLVGLQRVQECEETDREEADLEEEFEPMSDLSVSLPSIIILL